jgi:ubiquinone biosynthesis protein Coq4
MTKQRRENIQIDKIRDEKGYITTNTNERIIRHYFKTYSSKLENLDKIDKFLDAYNQPKLNQKDINHLNSPITCNEIEAIIKSLPYKEEHRTLWIRSRILPNL